MAPTKDARIDAYIENAAPFARPVLRKLRKCVHAGCPTVVETIKWGHPSFTHDGRILAYMAAFKAHAAFGFWRHARLKSLGLEPAAQKAMGQFGRLASTDDLPADAKLVALVRAAVGLAGQAPPRRAKPKATTRPRTRALEPPADLLAALQRNRKALATFEALSPSHQREYVEWITEAKRAETRARRLATAVEWMAEGKRRDWKYRR